LVEQLTLNQRVQGSNPCTPTNACNSLEFEPWFFGLDGTRQAACLLVRILAHPPKFPFFRSNLGFFVLDGTRQAAAFRFESLRMSSAAPEGAIARMARPDLHHCPVPMMARGFALCYLIR
jgi:hypothetical protein